MLRRARPRGSASPLGIVRACPFSASAPMPLPLGTSEAAPPLPPRLAGGVAVNQHSSKPTLMAGPQPFFGPNAR